jgi:hypothetical protein
VFFNEIINYERYEQVNLDNLKDKEKLYDWFQQNTVVVLAAHMSVQALSYVFETDLSAVVFGQHIHPTLILVHLGDFFF